MNKLSTLHGRKRHHTKTVHGLKSEYGGVRMAYCGQFDITGNRIRQFSREGVPITCRRCRQLEKICEKKTGGSNE